MTEVTTLCSLWKLKLRDDRVYRFTDHDDVIWVSGESYNPQYVAEIGTTEKRIGFGVDSGGILMSLTLPNMTAQHIRNGAFDGAELTQFRHDWVSGETKLLSKSRAGEVRLSGYELNIEWLGQTSLLDQTIGRVYSKQCDASFGDARCGLNRDDYDEGTQCPRDFKSCRDSFNNSVNFRGFPYLIGDDALQAGVLDSDPRDGSSRYL